VQQPSIRYDNGVIKMTAFDKAWGIVKGSNCATHNCEDNCTEKDWSYCGKKDCASCGGGCGDDDCRKCNPDAKW